MFPRIARFQISKSTTQLRGSSPSAVSDCSSDSAGNQPRANLALLKFLGRARPDSQLDRTIAISMCCLLITIASVPEFGFADDLQAKRIQSWKFQRNEDRNSDQWPDGWRRQIGREYPQYIPIQIVPRDLAKFNQFIDAQHTTARLWSAAEQKELRLPQTIESIPESLAAVLDNLEHNNHCLEIRMDGGKVELESAPFELDARFGYSVEGEVSCDTLDGYRAWFELSLLNSQQKLLRTQAAPSVSGTKPWSIVSTPMFDNQLSELQYGKLVIKVEPTSAARITGKVRFDALHLVRIPRLTLSCKAPSHVTSPAEPIEIVCHATGLRSDDNEVFFQLVDHTGKIIQQQKVKLKLNSATLSNELAKAKPEKTPSPKAPHYVSRSKSNGRTPGAFGALPLVDGTALWKLALPLPGYYRVRVDLGEASRRMRTREISVAVIEPGLAATSNPFGLSFPPFSSTLTPSDVPRLIQTAGANWAKFHIWFEADQTSHAEQLSWLVERLHSLNIKNIGKVTKPTVTPTGMAATRDLAMANYFQPNSNWETELEPIVLRMSMKLVWFQIGDDHDLGFISQPTASQDVADLRSRIQAYSQEELSLAIPWKWTEALPSDSTSSWQATQFVVQPELSAPELASHFAEKPTHNMIRWGTLDPLPADRYTTLDRVRDLCERMIAAKRLGAEACFATQPLDKQRGIFNPDGTAGELLIPFRSMALNFGGAKYVGTIDMPSGSINYVFRNGDDGVMILWNDRDVVEKLYLGDDVKGHDVWGRTVEVQTHRETSERTEQSLDVGAWTLILSGISIPVAEWGRAFQLKSKNLDSSVDQTKVLQMTLANTFGQAVSGKVRAVAPSLIQPTSPAMQFQLHDDNPRDLEMPIVLTSNASAGNHTVRFDFDINADRRYQFSMYRQITLGLNDVQMDWTLQRQADGRTVLRLELQNHTADAVSFDCKLFPPARPYQRFQISRANPGRTLREFWVALPMDIESKEFWLRCEQVGTNRVLNFRVEATQ